MILHSVVWLPLRGNYSASSVNKKVPTWMLFYKPHLPDKAYILEFRATVRHERYRVFKQRFCGPKPVKWA